MTTDRKTDEVPPEPEDEALWQLLQRAPRPRPVSPYFARRVLREVSALEEVRSNAGGISSRLAHAWQAWRRQGRAVSMTGALAAVALLAAGGAELSSWGRHSPVISQPPETSVAVNRVQPAAADVPEVDETTPADDLAANDAVAPLPTVAVASEPVVTAQDVEVIADLDNILSREENRLWTEDDTARF